MTLLPSALTLPVSVDTGQLVAMPLEMSIMLVLWVTSAALKGVIVACAGAAAAASKPEATIASRALCLKNAFMGNSFRLSVRPDESA